MSFLALFIPDKPAQTLLVCLIFSLTILLDLQTHFHFISLTFYWTGSFDCYKKNKKNQRHSEPQTAGRSSRSFHPCTEMIPFYSTELIANLLFITPVNLDFFSFDCLWEFYRLCQCYSRWKSFHNQAFLKDISAVTFVLVTTMAW